MILEIGNPLSPTPPHVTEYCISTNIMHGDADHREELKSYETNYFDAIVLFGAIQEYYNKLKGRSIQEYDYKVLAKWIKMFPASNYHKEAVAECDGDFQDYAEVWGYDILEELWPTDVTCHDWISSLQGVNITYFNENGIEHSVTLEK